ncbi:hypothetical protein NPIL_150441 [Nephila pilipes]|uniref:Spider venom protein n=1 Tax=Nephila pilipes TaxID=299642 RepID=A0A8X6MZD3_NEPPI|nr:hypothetical protein NPIL_150441 [Nephila pilipes]
MRAVFLIFLLIAFIATTMATVHHHVVHDDDKDGGGIRSVMCPKSKRVLQEAAYHITVVLLQLEHYYKVTGSAN